MSRVLALLLISAPMVRADTDVCIYGGTANGVAAAIQTARMGKTVVLIEPSKHIGGLTSGGLGWTDSGDKGAVGGISREFYQRVKKHYDRPEAWTHEKRDGYKSYRPGDDAMWTGASMWISQGFMQLGTATGRSSSIACSSIGQRRLQRLRPSPEAPSATSSYSR